MGQVHYQVHENNKGVHTIIKYYFFQCYKCFIVLYLKHVPNLIKAFCRQLLYCETFDSTEKKKIATNYGLSHFLYTYILRFTFYI